jgi:hypothetical protein
MSPKGKKLEPKLGLDMGFDEALERFVRTSPAEVDASIERSKQKKPPQAKKTKSKLLGSKKAPPSTLDDQSVVSLRDRRMRKRNYGR